MGGRHWQALTGPGIFLQALASLKERGVTTFAGGCIALLCFLVARASNVNGYTCTRSIAAVSTGGMSAWGSWGFLDLGYLARDYLEKPYAEKSGLAAGKALIYARATRPESEFRPAHPLSGLASKGDPPDL
ncbi:hypothetical protein M501DRAFT_1059718 [Patellaria atrata CBS 101060]|uniref:Uncharacterized protein n=1 Tax=Patellaria atrata CBS 101060 TaxID=1346257 RepID=A0A9P4VML6_9PEZI|nr:hypothetical protein M501DRAFT_1059718 [Patellaria atrata CBS 101060]